MVVFALKGIHVLEKNVRCVQKVRTRILMGTGLVNPVPQRRLQIEAALNCHNVFACRGTHILKMDCHVWNVKRARSRIK
jgi:hypothetical protein